MDSTEIRLVFFTDTDFDGYPDSLAGGANYSLIEDNDDDNDGLSDEEEINIYHSSPINPDSNDDGICDGYQDVGEVCIAKEKINEIEVDKKETSYLLWIIILVIVGVVIAISKRGNKFMKNLVHIGGINESLNEIDSNESLNEIGSNESLNEIGSNESLNEIDSDDFEMSDDIVSDSVESDSEISQEITDAQQIDEFEEEKEQTQLDIHAENERKGFISINPRPKKVIRDTTKKPKF